MGTTRGFNVAGAALAAALTGATAAQAQNCLAPWITQAIREVTGSAPKDSGERGVCTYTQYNNGQWNNYDELKAAVQRKLGRITDRGTFTMSVPKNQLPSLPSRSINGQTQYMVNGKWGRIVGQDAASYNLIGDGGGT